MRNIDDRRNIKKEENYAGKSSHSCRCQSTGDACNADARAKRFFVDLEAKNLVYKLGVVIPGSSVYFPITSKAPPCWE